MKVSYYSLGCKVNLYESEAIINQFLDNGFTLASFDDICDVYIINTCTVTQTSDAKSRKTIRQAIKRNPDAVISVMGCYAQLSPEDIKKIAGVDVLVGTHNRLLLYPLTIKALEEKGKYIAIEDIGKIKNYEQLKIDRYNNKTRGFIKIEDGCNNFCTYCAIPYARGRVRSRDSQSIIEEVTTLTNEGMKEIVLTGINTAAYGLDLDDYSFSDLLLDLVNKVPNLGRIRISSIEATEIDDQLLNVIAANKEKFCNHFHIPLQNGSDNVLQKMARKYNTAYYKEKIEKIRNIFPDANITSDILIGFNYETNEDYKTTYNFIKEMGFGEIHVFPYSRREGTKAYDFDHPIDEATKKFRVNELLKLNKELALNYRNQFQDETLEVIVEKIENGYAFGHSSNYISVRFKAENVKPNDLVNVKLTKINYPISQGVQVGEEK